MIVKTTKVIGGIECDYTCSDAGVKIERNGERYAEAIDPLNSGRSYTETDEPIENTDEATEGDYRGALREMGVAV